MPRKSKGGGRGGPRTGTPGTAYSNRTDLNAATQPVRTAPSQTYGDATAQAAAQHALPLPGPGAGSPPSPSAAGPGTSAGTPAPAPPGPMPGALGPLTAPSARPNEPITAGLSTGPGPGPEALGAQPQMPEADPTVFLLKGLLSRYPNPDVQALLNQAQAAPPTPIPHSSLASPQLSIPGWAGQRGAGPDPSSFQGPNGQLVPDIGQHDMGRRR